MTRFDQFNFVKKHRKGLICEGEIRGKVNIKKKIRNGFVGLDNIYNR